MNYFRRLDPFLLLPSLSISGISIFLLLSTSPNLAGPQLIYSLIGVFLYLMFTSLDIRFIPKYTFQFYIFSVIFLLIIFLLPQIRGAHRWIDFGFFILQPSEILKPLIIITFASFLSKDNQPGPVSIVGYTLGFLPFLVLIFLQPDLGNAIIYLSFFTGLLIISGVYISILLTGFLSFFTLLPGIWLILKDYQKQRLFSFINPNLDPSGAGYNAIQSMIAIGSGGLAGLGLGRGTQSRLLFLPEYQTDFIFASLVESLGFFGGFILLILYIIILVRILLIALNSEYRLGRLLAVGIFCQIFAQIFINIAMNLGLLPITGITLPLLSYGGSSLVSTYISLGLISSLTSVIPKKLLVIR